MLLFRIALLALAFGLRSSGRPLPGPVNLALQVLAFSPRSLALAWGGRLIGGAAVAAASALNRAPRRR